MRVRVLGSYGGNTNFTNLTNFTINEALALDAGCMTSVLSLEEQLRITDVIISHSHMDHVTSLPFLVDNLFGETKEPLRIWASEHVIECLKKHIFNHVIWPDFSSIMYNGQPSIIFKPIIGLKEFQIGNLKVTPIPVNHIVPTFGFYIEDQNDGFLFTSDTSNTDLVWEEVNKREKLKAIVVDCSFPNHMEDLAIKSGHLTPKLLARDLEKLRQDCQIFVYHAKPSFEKQIKDELDELGLSHLQMNIQGTTLSF